MMSSEKGRQLSEDPLLAREKVYSTDSDFDTEPFRSSTSLEEEERARTHSRSNICAVSYCSSLLCLVMVGVAITFVLFVLLLLKDPWQLMAILIVLALVTTAVLMMCAYRMRVRE